MREVSFRREKNGKVVKRANWEIQARDEELQRGVWGVREGKEAEVGKVANSPIKRTGYHLNLA